MNKRSCSTCNMGKFDDRTPTGRIKRDTVGECLYEVPIPALPSSVRISIRKVYVAQDDGADCPLHCAKK